MEKAFKRSTPKETSPPNKDPTVCTNITNTMEAMRHNSMFDCLVFAIILFVCKVSPERSQHNSLCNAPVKHYLF